MRLALITFFLLISSSSFANDAYVDTETGFAFPRTIAGFKFDSRKEYGDPELGYGMDYWNENGILITVIVYDLGIKNILDGIQGPHVQQQFKQSRGDVDKALELGFYKSAHRINGLRGFSPLFLRFSYTIVRKGDVQSRSHLFIRGQNQRFVKVRATGPANNGIDRQVSMYIDQLSEILRSK